jgi:hypothetical protein
VATHLHNRVGSSTRFAGFSNLALILGRLTSCTRVAIVIGWDHGRRVMRDAGCTAAFSERE